MIYLCTTERVAAEMVHHCSHQGPVDSSCLLPAWQATEHCCEAVQGDQHRSHSAGHDAARSMCSCL